MNENSSTGNKPAVNVGNTERMISAVAGGFLLYNAISGKNARMLKAGAGAFLLYRALTGNCPVYSMLKKKRLPDPVRNINVRVSMTVNRPRAEVYAFWRNLENLPLFMDHVKAVTPLGNGHYHWEAQIPGLPASLKWEAAIIKEEEGELLGWNSLPGADIDNAGKVTFADAGENATELHVVITYRAPLGAAGNGIARLLNPLFKAMIREELRSFSQYIGNGVVPATREQASGNAASTM